MSKKIELDLIACVVNCHRTDKDELMSTISCIKCKLFIKEEEDGITCFRPVKIKKYKAGTLPEVEKK